MFDKEKRDGVEETVHSSHERKPQVIGADPASNGFGVYLVVSRLECMLLMTCASKKRSSSPPLCSGLVVSVFCTIFRPSPLSTLSPTATSHISTTTVMVGGVGVIRIAIGADGGNIDFNENTAILAQVARKVKFLGSEYAAS